MQSDSHTEEAAPYLLNCWYAAAWSDELDTAKAAPSLHLMTPETKHSTFYFWAVGRETRLNDPEFTEQMRAGFIHAFEHEDKPMIAQQQVMMEDQDFWNLEPVVLKGDIGAVMARRKLLQLLREERDSAANRN